MNTSAGLFFYCKTTKRFLYLLRADSYSWGVPGGKLEKDESILEGLERECMEEIGYFPKDVRLVPLQKFVNNTFTYHTFFCAVNEEFIPKLNYEHVGYAWILEDQHPKPMHSGLFSTVNIDNVREKINSLTK